MGESCVGVVVAASMAVKERRVRVELLWCSCCGLYECRVCIKMCMSVAGGWAKYFAASPLPEEGRESNGFRHRNEYSSFSGDWGMGGSGGVCGMSHRCFRATAYFRISNSRRVGVLRETASQCMPLIARALLLPLYHKRCDCLLNN